MKTTKRFSFFNAVCDGESIVVVSKRDDFDPSMGYTVVQFDTTRLAFVDSDEFTPQERQAAYEAFCKVVQPRQLKAQAFEIAKQRAPILFDEVAQNIGWEDDDGRDFCESLYTGALASGIEIGLELAARMAEVGSHIDDDDDTPDEPTTIITSF